MNYYKLSRFFLFLVPLSIVVVSNGTLFPFIVGKYAVFRGLTDLALIFFLLGVIFDSVEWPAVKERILKVIKNPLVIAISVFVVAFLLACFFGYDPAASFWANFERGEGGLQIITLYIFFLLTLFLFRREGDWRKLLKVSLIAAVLMIAYGVLAALNVQGFIGVPLNFANRFEGSLGNPEYVAPYLTFSIFFALYFFLYEKKRSVKWFLGGLIALLFAFFVMSQTRGAFGGLAAGIIAFLLYMAFAQGGKWRKWGLTFLVVCLLAGSTGIYFRKSEFVQKLPGGRFFDISLSQITPRLLTWGTALRGFEARPIFGWGPENFAVVFDKYFNPAIYNSPNAQTWFDRAHDVFLDYAAETGAVGLLSYLGVLATFFVVLFKKFHPKKPERPSSASISSDQHRSATQHIVLTGLFLAVIVQYIVQGLPMFDVLPIYLVLYMTLAFFVFKVLERHESSKILNTKS